MYFDAAIVGAANGFNDGEPKAGATELARAGCINPEETVESVRQGGGGNTNAVVGHFQHRSAAARGNRNLDGTAGRRVFNGIIEQVDDDLLQARGVAFDHDGFTILAGE